MLRMCYFVVVDNLVYLCLISEKVIRFLFIWYVGLYFYYLFVVLRMIVLFLMLFLSCRDARALQEKAARKAGQSMGEGNHDHFLCVGGKIKN